MAKVSLALKEKYVDTLDKASYARYLEKIATIGGEDPYELPDSAWTPDHDALPPLRNEDAVQYLIFGKSAYTMAEFKAMKSLQAHNQLTSGWVRDLRSYRSPNSPNVLVAAKVYHSQRMNEKPTQPWLITSGEGEVLSAHCTCVAGLGETCSHVAAVMFMVDTAKRIIDNKTVTDVACYWNQPSFKSVAYLENASIDFTSAPSRKRMLDASVESKTASPKAPKRTREIKDVTENELKSFYEQIKFAASGIKPALLSVQSEYAEDYEIKLTRMPPLLTGLREDRFMTLNFMELHQECLKVIASGSLSFTHEECNLVEQHTRLQVKSPLWFRLRAGRVTASKLHSVCHTNLSQPAHSLISSICYTNSCSTKTTEAMQWGIEHEDQGRAEYEEKQKNSHTGFKMTSCGLIMDPEIPFMAASPDAYCSCKCCGELREGCVEVKCPFTARQITIEEALSLPNFPLHRVGTHICLKLEHAYYSQVQCQLLLSKRAYCDFVIWTQKELFVERVLPDVGFWEEAVPKAQQFFETAVLPEMLGGFYTSGSCTNNPRAHSQPVNPPASTDAKSPLEPVQQNTDATDPVAPVNPTQPSNRTDAWCYCGRGEEGNMVACDSVNCTRIWFHFECIGMKSEPKGKWFCPDCRKNRPKRGKAEPKRKL